MRTLLRSMAALRWPLTSQPDEDNVVELSASDSGQFQLSWVNGARRLVRQQQNQLAIRHLVQLQVSPRFDRESRAVGLIRFDEDLLPLLIQGSGPRWRVSIWFHGQPRGEVYVSGQQRLNDLSLLLSRYGYEVRPDQSVTDAAKPNRLAVYDYPIEHLLTEPSNYTLSQGVAPLDGSYLRANYPGDALRLVFGSGVDHIPKTFRALLCILQ